MRYLPHTPRDVQSMLEAVGAPGVDALFASIPAELRLNRPLALPPPMDEVALLEELERLAAMNKVDPPFLGAGAYPHHVPPAVDQLLLRSEFYTAYTPYQPEVAQGTLQAIFEFQTFVALLTGQQVANASMYDGATALAEAALMAVRVGKTRRRVVVARSVHPCYRRVVRTYASTAGCELVEVGFGADGRVDSNALRAALDANAAALLCGHPNYFGVAEDLPALAAAAHGSGAMLVTSTPEALALGLLAAPGALGADACTGEMQSFGNGMSFGGPGLGFFATRDEHVRQMPGRLCGATADRDGRRGFVLTLSTREQHIRRERATSNICTNHGLNALAAAIHLALLGKRGLRELALVNWRRARHLRELLAARGAKPAFTGPVFNEFAVRLPDATAARERAQREGLVAGRPLGEDDPELADALLLCVTELHSPARIAKLAAALAG